jgi:hypothetical protein
MANQHRRWELNDLARRLDIQPAAVNLREEVVPSPATSGSGLTPDGLRMLLAIEALPDDGCLRRTWPTCTRGMFCPTRASCMPAG